MPKTLLTSSASTVVLSHWSKALAMGAMVLATLALILFVSSVFTQGKKRVMMQRPLTLTPTEMMYEESMGWDGSEPMMGTVEDSMRDMAVPPMAMGAPAMEKSMPSMMGGTVVGALRKVSTTASLDMRAKSLDWTVNKITEIVKNVGGFVENSSTSQPERGIRMTWMIVKVPTDRFDAVLTEVKQTADQVVSENVGSTDLTAQNIDLSARLKNKRAEEKAYENLLSSATRVSDVIEITQQLTGVRSEIESMEQQMRYLEGQTALVTLNLNITEDPQVQGNTGEFKRGNVFKAALNTLVDALLALGSGLIVFLITGLPILLILLGVLWVVYRLAKRAVEGFFSRM